MTAQQQAMSNIAIPSKYSTKNHTPEVFAYDENNKPLYFKTYNYELFEFYHFNREVRQSKVRELAKVIKDYSICPIQVKKGSSGKLFIIDGQHRLHAAKRTGNPIFYRIIDADPSCIADMQVSSKWNIIDWVNYYCSHRMEDYVTLRKLFDEHNVSMTALIAMLTLKNSGKDKYSISTNANDKIRKGTFKITTLKFANKILAQMNDYPKDIRNNLYFIRALIRANTACEILRNYTDRIFSEYHHDVAKKKLEKYPEKVGKRGDVLGYIRMIEDLMNAGNRGTTCYSYRFI